MKYGLLFIALALLAAGAISLLEISAAGFPDGHLTEYERAALPLLRTISLIQLFSGLATIITAFTSLRRSRALLIIAVLMLLSSLALQHIIVPFFFQNHLQLDNGQGG